MGPDELFKRIVRDGWSGVDRWVAEQEPETYYLEFKGRGNAAPRLALFDKQHLGRSVSAFANESGGVLVFGIDTEKVEGVDRARTVRPAPSVTSYAEALNRHLLICSDPHVPGAHAVPILDPSQNDTGIVAVYIPQSDGGPHRAMCAGDEWTDRYFSRMGTSNMVLTHRLLSAMFGRLPPPDLRLVSERHVGNEYELRIVNHGRGYAKNPIIRMEIEGALGGVPAVVESVTAFGETYERGWERTYRRRGATDRAYATLSRDLVVYPNDELRVAVLRLHQTYETVRVRGRIDAEGMAPVRFAGRLPSSVGSAEELGTE
jgi:hypothetical protein